MKIDGAGINVISMEIYSSKKNGIAVGSVLGPIFRDFYISALENKVFNTIDKLNIYLRYGDDILLTNSTDEINTIQ